MSTANDPVALSELLMVYDNIRTSSWVAFACFAFFLYDYILTLSREAKVFWTRQLSSAKVLYFVIRYSTLLYQILDTLEPATILTTTSCLRLFKTSSVIQALTSLPLAVFSALRAYSLAKSRTIFAFIFILSLAPLGANLVQYWKDMGSDILQINHLCVETDAFTQQDVIILVSRVGLIIADAILVSITWRTLGRGPDRPRFPHENRGSLASIILWNGVMYFVQVPPWIWLMDAWTDGTFSAMLVLNVLHLVLSITALFSTTNGPSNIALLTDPLTIVLATRLLLDLQEANQRAVKVESGHDLHISQSEGSLSFARVVGPIGSFIGTGLAEEHTSDEEESED